MRSRKGHVELVKITRLESQRTRMRKVTDKGTDVIITLDQGSQLKHNDVILMTDNKMIIVELEPESVAVVDLKEDTLRGDEKTALLLKIGHTIGNLHRPIKVQGKKIMFPIQSDDEIEMFRRLLHSAKDHVAIKKSVTIFEPDSEMQAHEH